MGGEKHWARGNSQFSLRIKLVIGLIRPQQILGPKLQPEK